MHRSRGFWLLLPALLGSCADSCGCGKKPAAGAKAPEPHGQVAPAHPNASSVATGQAGGAAAAVSTLGQPAWQEAPTSALTTKLENAKLAIDADRKFAKLASETALSAVLRDKLGKLKASAPASVAARGDGPAKLAIVARDYAGAGGKTARVKVTDTGLLPNARHTVSNRLTLIGNAITGNEHGALVHNAPAIVGHFDDEKVSRATALLADRYLVEVVVRGASDPDEALRVIEQVNLASLGGVEQGRAATKSK